ncbi:MAG: hypothetical protein J0L91_03465 [Burkholderiales bacterium]|nr:hypothetical protein [Burkholderiales bacterium]
MTRAPYASIAGAAAGAALFFLLLDPRLLDPGNWLWLMDGDPAAQYLGWRFFRAEPWQWPPGALRTYGHDIGAGIVFTDSIPIAAFAAKLLSPLLPSTFQYFGLWALLCFVLQGFFAGLLATVAAERPLQRLAVTALLVASLPVVDRAIGHFALMSHWLLLWGLWLALRPHRELATGPWVALTCIASLVHAYLLAMVLALWVADVLRRRHFDPLPRPDFGDWVRHVVVVSLALWGTMALAGYFDLPRGAVSGGSLYFGKYAANLNAFWNPGWGSRFLPDLPVIKGSELEGYGYLGLGVLALLAVALLALVRPGGAPVNWRPYAPLVAIAIGLWLVALSHKIAWGDRIVVELPLRDRPLELVATFRASGRMIWVAFYGLVFASAAIVAARFAPAAASVLLVGATALQIADLSPRYAAMRPYFDDRYIAQPAKRETFMRSPFWSEAAKTYRTIRVAPVANMAHGWPWLALYAVDHGMSVNTGQFSRPSFPRMAAANDALTRTLVSGPLAPDTLYLLWSKDTRFDWAIGAEDGAGTIDTYFVVAPGWFSVPRASIAPDALARGPAKGLAP